MPYLPWLQYKAVENSLTCNIGIGGSTQLFLFDGFPGQFFALYYIRTTRKTGKKKIYLSVISKDDYKKNLAKEILKESYGGSLKDFVVSLSGGEGISNNDADEQTPLPLNLEWIKGFFLCH